MRAAARRRSARASTTWARSGAGHTAKLLNNFLNGISLAATAEVMVAARKAGLELHTFLDVLNNSSGVNFATLNRFPRIVDGDYLEGGLTGNLMLKDLRLYADLIRELGVRDAHRGRLHRGVRARRRARVRRADLATGSSTRSATSPAVSGCRTRPTERIGRMKINQRPRGRHASPTSAPPPSPARSGRDPVLPETDGVLINNVFFAPGARTHWHTHDQGQILAVHERPGPGPVARRQRREAHAPATSSGSRPARSTGTAPTPTATCSTWRSRSAATSGSTRSSDDEYGEGWA